MLVKSIYTLLFSENGLYYLYNSRSNFFSQISEELYEILLDEKKLAKLDNNASAELLKREIIVDDSDKYTYYYSKLLRFNAANNDLTILNLIIAPTTGCNFDCPYCFESKKVSKTMCSEVIDSLVDFVKSHEKTKEIMITWYGGEPLIAFDKIKEINKKFHDNTLPKITSQSFITNGYYLNKEVIEFIKSIECTSIQITVDGLYEKHDKTRRLKNSIAPTFGHILNNIRSLISEVPDINLNIRVNVNKKNYLDFVDVYKFFKSEFPNNKVSVYPGIIKEETEDSLGLCDSSFSTSEILDLYDLLRTAGLDTSEFPKREHRGCMMHQNSSYVIGPEGEIYKCWSDITKSDAIIGYINNNKLVNSSRLIKYAVQAIPYNDKCKECYVFPICDGGCGSNRYRNMFEGCHFDLCSPYKDVERLKKVLLNSSMSVDAL